MKILMFGDLHSTPEASYSTPLPGGATTHLLNVGMTFEWLRGLVMEHSPDLVVNLGDTTDTTGFIHTASLAFVSEGLQGLQKECQTVDAQFLNLLGNHDKEAGQYHNLCWFRGANVVEKWSLVNIVGYRCLFVSWLAKEDLEPFKEFLETASFDLAFVHLPLNGALMGGGTLETSDEAFHLADFVEREAATLRCSPGLFAAHYHTPQIFKSAVAEPGLAHIVGTVLARNFKDARQAVDMDGTRGAVLVDVSKEGISNLARIENPFSLRFFTYDFDKPGDMAVLSSLEPDRSAIRVDYAPELGDGLEELTKPFAYKVLRRKVQSIKTRQTDISILATPESNLKQYLVLSDTEDLDESGLWSIAESGLAGYDGSKKPQQRKIKFISVELEGFLSIGHVKYDFKDRGLTGLRGNNRDAMSNDNGSGKSAISMDGPWWVITGTLLTRDGKGDEVCNDRQKGGARGWLKMMVNDDEYVIERGRKHKKLKNGLRVWKNGEEFEHRRPSDVQAALDKILGEGFKDYLLQSVFLGEGLAGKFSSRGYADRARLLQRYIDTGPYDHLNNYVVAKDAEFNDSAMKHAATAQALQYELEKVREEISTLTQQKVAYEAQAQAKSQDLELQMEDKRNSILAHKTKLSELFEQRDAKAKEKYEVDHQLEAVNTRRQQVQDIVDNFLSESNASHTSYKTAETLLNRAATLADQGKCDKCGQTVSADLLGVGEHVESTETARKVWEAAEKAYKIAYGDAKRLQAKWDVVFQRQQALLGEARQIDDVLSKERVQMDALKATLQSLQNELLGLQQGVAPYQEAISRADDRQIDILGREEKARNAAETAQQNLVYYTWWKKHLSLKGFRSFLLDQLAGFMNGILAELSKYLFGGDARVLLTTTRKLKGGADKNEIHINVEGYRSMGLVSSGERRRIDILLQIAQAMTSASLSLFSCNLMGMDEVFDKLDKSGLESVMQLLSYVAQDRWLLVTSHNPLISEAIDEQWVAVKESGITRLVTSD